MSWTDDIELPDPRTFRGVTVIMYTYKTEVVAVASDWVSTVASFKLTCDAVTAADALWARLLVTRRLLGLA